MFLPFPMPRISGKERDAESGLDYFGARYFSGAQGRFTSPDPVLISNQRLVNPQQWNLYSYSGNNPLANIDPDGREVQVLDEEALKRIRSTLPVSLRANVILNKRGFIDKAALNKIKTKDANFNDLKELVNMGDTLEVATATSVNMGGKVMPFEYESVKQIVADLKSKGYNVDPKGVIPTIFLGKTDGKGETASGIARVILSDGTGKAAGAPIVEHAITSAHEIYGHALLDLRNMPWLHDGPGKPVDTRIKQIEDRTRRLYEKK
jgi:RHS repeat-associated protein